MDTSTSGHAQWSRGGIWRQGVASRQSGLGRGSRSHPSRCARTQPSPKVPTPSTADHEDAVDGHAERDHRRSSRGHRLGYLTRLQDARRARRAVRRSRTRPSCSTSPASGARSSAPVAGRSTPTTRRCSRRRPASTPSRPLDDPELDRALVLSLCTLALRLDVLRYDAWHDPLTGLYDRRSFDRLLEMAVARSVRYGWPFTLVMLDLDDLKAINDREGHAAGDEVLRDLGERFRRVLRFGDNAARIGGDEFAMILPDTEPDAVPFLLERVRTTPGAHEPRARVLVRHGQVPRRRRRLRRARTGWPTRVSTRRRTPGERSHPRRPRARAAEASGRARRGLRRPRRAAHHPASRRARLRRRGVAAARGDAHRGASRRSPGRGRGRAVARLGTRRPTAPHRRCRHRADARDDVPSADDGGRRGGRSRRVACGCSPCSRSPTPTSSRCT